MAQTTEDGGGETSWASVFDSVFGIADNAASSYAKAKAESSANPNDYDNGQRLAVDANGQPVVYSAGVSTQQLLIYGGVGVLLLVLVLVVVKAV